MEKVAISQKTENIDALRKIFSPLADVPEIQVFVHGSWADSSRTAFSDLDDLIILNSSLSKDKQKEVEGKLDDVEMVFQRMDPLQHHGHWIISKEKLQHYDNSYIPLFILENAILIYGKKNIEANIDAIRTKEGLIRNIKRTCEDIENLYDLHEKGKLNLYKLKGWAGSFVLLPALVFQLKGLKMDKKEAILRSGEIFDEDSMRLIQWSTDIRNHWARLLDHEQYKRFVERIEHYSDAREWRAFAQQNAPVLDYEGLSSVKIEKHLIDGMVGQALGYVDEQRFRRLQSEDYQSAYQRVEASARDHGAIAVGRFGEVRYPSISDLDVFICFPDEKYSAGVQAIDQLVSDDETLHYIFTHAPLYVATSILPAIKYLHSLYGLTITWSKEEFSFDNRLSMEYTNFFSCIWTLFLLRIISNGKMQLNYYDTRFLLLLIKNVHTSIHNLERIMGKPSVVLEKSKDIRERVLRDGIQARSQVEETFKEAVSLLFHTLKLMDSGFQPKRKSLVVTRSLLFCLSDQYRIEKTGHKTIYYLDGYLFDIACQLYTRRGKEALLYFEAHSRIDCFVKKYGVKNPFFYPFHINPLHINVGHRSLSGFMKEAGIYLLNLLPVSLKAMAFKKL